MPPKRSVFDETYKEGQDRIDALSFYVDQITQPVIIDGNRPIDYVPSQLLTEAFRWWATPAIDGIAYPSRIHEGGKNVVLFFDDERWIETAGGDPVSRMTIYEREEERNRSEAIFVIDPKSIRRRRVKRSITVE